MIRTFFIVFTTLSFVACKPTGETGISAAQQIVSSDITHFWDAFDAIVAEPDTLEHLELLQSLFLDKASEGQKRMMTERRYTPAGYLNAIRTRSGFWQSIRSNTENLDGYNAALRAGVDRFAEIYPELKPSTIYYTIGNHRSPGTGVDSMVLIGTEFALGDTTTYTAELPEHNRNYYRINPVDHLSFLCVHEYVHTQQEAMVHNLLSLSMYEGIAEFVAIKAMGRTSPWKAFTYGPEHEERIRERFEEDMFKPNVVFNWLWNSPNNEFGTSDLGYFVGHQIAARYYDACEDKQYAIRKLIELNYENEEAVEHLVDTTQYFSRPLADLYADYEANRPTVTGVRQFDNRSQDVDPNLKEITVLFSRPLNGHHTGVDFGPLGQDAFPQGTLEGRHWANDHKSWTLPVSLERDKHYQILISNNFRTTNGHHLKEYLIDFKTRK